MTARAYYSSSILDFLRRSDDEVLGEMSRRSGTSNVTLQQKNTWVEQIKILKDQLQAFQDGGLLLEYTIPRLGKRIDAVVLHQGCVYVLEFKCGEKHHLASTDDQVMDYALDLQNFHKESRDRPIVAVSVATLASAFDGVVPEQRESVVGPIRCNAATISDVLKQTSATLTARPLTRDEWEDSEYLPTPTIVEAARALYQGHDVSEITRSDAGARNLSTTAAAVGQVIARSKRLGRKSICFVTGVPGAGKTLVGLDVAIQRSDAENGEHAVFLSGNYPLVTVLQEALARDHVEQAKAQGVKVSKKDALRRTNAFIQIIHRYRDSFVGNNDVPPERVVIFDEAQRAWTRDQISAFMKTRKGVPNFDESEPQFLIGTADRLEGWATIVCLVGGGQEINTGEAGLPAWFDALRESFPEWDVYCPPELEDEEYLRGQSWADLTQGLSVRELPELHLATSIRSFRTPHLAKFVKALLDRDLPLARKSLQTIGDKYPIVITRNLDLAKQWAREKSLGSTRCGLLASSGGSRLKPEGIFVKNKFSVANWFLNDKRDVRSSNSLEDVATEFEVQGLEHDYAVVAWDADLRVGEHGWDFRKFRGTAWQAVRDLNRQNYLKNAYRVLLTRARQGFVIFVPEGDETDPTRDPVEHDRIYQYLTSAGIVSL